MCLWILAPKSLMKIMPPLFTKHHYIFEMITNFANNIVFIFSSLEVRVSLDLGLKSLMKIMPPLFTEHHYIFEMITNLANNIVLIFSSLEVLECLWTLAPK